MPAAPPHETRSGLYDGPVTALPVKKSRWAAMRALTDRLEPQVATAVLADLRALRRNIRPAMLERAIQSGGSHLVAGMVLGAARTSLGLPRTGPLLDEAFFGAATSPRAR